jgi:glycosyltransferase involved in cell wall biosynthesis
MRLAAVSIVRNECDIIEQFVRHATTLFDRVYVIDNASGDSTAEILQRLAAEGLPLTIGHNGNSAYYQARRTTELIHRAIADHEWDFIFPIDGDEFLNCDRLILERELSTLATGCAAMIDSDQYVPTEGDDQSQLDPVRRIIHRAVTDPPIEPRIGKAVIPGPLAKLSKFSISEGNHLAFLDGERLPLERRPELRLAHFPVRSKEQFIARVVVNWLAWLARTDYHPSMSWHLGKFYEQIKSNPELSLSDLTEAALSYVDTYIERDPKTYRKLVVRDPFFPLYKQLRYTGLIRIAVLPRIMEMAELLSRAKAKGPWLPWASGISLSL